MYESKHIQIDAVSASFVLDRAEVDERNLVVKHDLPDWLAALIPIDHLMVYPVPHPGRREPFVVIGTLEGMIRVNATDLIVRLPDETITVIEKRVFDYFFIEATEPDDVEEPNTVEVVEESIEAPVEPIEGPDTSNPIEEEPVEEPPDVIEDPDTIENPDAVEGSG